MHALVVYESMFGATRRLAEQVAEGMGDGSAVRCVRADHVSAADLADTDLVVLGAPIHARTLPSAASRREAATWPTRPGATVDLEPGAGSPGLRELIARSDWRGRRFACFGSRSTLPRILTGGVARAIRRRVRRAGGIPVAEPLDIRVDGGGTPTAGSLESARAWGRALRPTDAGTMSRPWSAVRSDPQPHPPPPRGPD